MRGISSWLGLMLMVSLAACVDPIRFDVDYAVRGLPVVVEGFITNEPGPYEIEVSRIFNLEAQAAVRERIPVKRMEISDNAGNSEVMRPVETGVYRTKMGGFQGVVGRAYKLRVELYDGRIYETLPDTMQPTGLVDRIGHEVVRYVNDIGVPEYGFDIFFDSQAGESRDFQFIWKLAMTYEITTNPEQYMAPCPGLCNDPKGCFCNEPLPCSGFTIDEVSNQLSYVAPCECCQCWIELGNDLPVMSDGELVQGGVFKNIKAGRLPITAWTMQNKARVEIQQFSLSAMAYNFWKAIKAQKEATTSLFQPLSGKITGNFEQLSGDPSPIEGIFYASAVSKSSIYLDYRDVPSARMIPTIGNPYQGRCTDFTGATNRMPKGWIP